MGPKHGHIELLRPRGTQIGPLDAHPIPTGIVLEGSDGPWKPGPNVARTRPESRPRRPEDLISPAVPDVTGNGAEVRISNNSAKPSCQTIRICD